MAPLALHTEIVVFKSSITNYHTRRSAGSVVPELLVKEEYQGDTAKPF
jgi:hypothetical protein